MSTEQTSLGEYSGELESEPEKPWQDKDWLYEQYWRDGKTQREIEDSVDISRGNLCYWFDKHGIQTRPGPGGIGGFVIHMISRQVLFRMYWEEGRSTQSIADKFGASRRAVSESMQQKDPPIKRRPGNRTGSGNHAYKTHPSFSTQRGYNIWRIGQYNGQSRYVMEHRMTAIAEWGLDAVKGKHIHHANGIKWLNVPEFDMDIPELENPNLVPMDPITHAKE